MNRKGQAGRGTLVLVLALVVGAAACGGGKSRSAQHKQHRTDPRKPVLHSVTPAESFGTPSAATHYWSPGRVERARPAPLLQAPSSPVVPQRTAPEGPQGSASGSAVAPAPPIQLPHAAPPPPSGGALARIPFVRLAWGGANKQPPASLEAKVSFVDPRDGNEYVCSGTVISTPNGSVVWTAAHCVYPHGSFATKVAVAPGYRAGRAPYGWWPARDLATTQGWINTRTPRLDLGAIVLKKVHGKTVEDAIGGGQGVAWDRRGQPAVDAFGYPAESPFDGEHLFHCISTAAGRLNPTPVAGGPPTVVIGCDMNGGASGGGWIVDFQAARGWDYVYSVNSQIPANGDPFMFGPYQGVAAKNLFDSVKSE